MDHHALTRVLLLLLVCCHWAQAQRPTAIVDPPPAQGDKASTEWTDKPLEDGLLSTVPGQSKTTKTDEFPEKAFQENEDDFVLYQGDMMLTKEQWQSVLQRKAIADERYRWPKSDTTGMVDIDYRYNDAIVSRPGVQKALAAWEAATCVRFHEVASEVAKPHLIFKTHDTRCNSMVGSIFSQNGQDVNLSPSCFNDDDVVVHELGHALGLKHEQSRSDRDDYVNIILDNVVAGMEHNFLKEETNNYGLPYDYSSVMHYFPTAFSKNDEYTVVTKDPLALPLIIDSKGLSFMDKKIVNLMYKCTDTWLAKCNLASEPCQNQGYTRSDCTCECPAGTKGANCETLIKPYIDALIDAKSPGSQRITTEGTVTSPDYPTPVTKATSRVQSIEAPECHKVKLTLDVFDMYGKVSLSTNGGPPYQGCYYNILEVKLDYPLPTSTQYCGGDLTAPHTFESVGRVMVLTFTSMADLASNTHTGYSATVQFVPVTTGDCASVPGNNTTSTISPNVNGTTFTTSSSTTKTTSTSPTVTETPSTTPAAPSPGKVINSGLLPLTPTISNGQCNLLLSALNPSVYFYRSPNYPPNYARGQRCTIWFNTNEPRYLKVTPLIVSLGPQDTLDLFTPYRNTTALGASTVGNAIIFPSASSRLSFVASTSSPGGRFNIRVEVLNTDCHQVIELEAGSTGNLSIPANYTAGTVCEWWLRAPVGRKVQVEFSRFFIGGSTCRRDSVVIDVTGDSRYVSGAKQYCGGNMYSPGTVVSTDNALNILVNGQWGNYLGLNATYSVV